MSYMPYRTVPLVTDEYYHVYNRGVAGMNIYPDLTFLKRFVKNMIYYQIAGPKPRYSLFCPTTTELDRSKKIVKIICHCLMPNHFHLLLKQAKDGGVSEFVRNLENSYTKYFNIRSKRVGPIFQGQFKAVLIESNEQLLHVSRYIHLNPLVSDVTNALDNYKWSSYPEYIGVSGSEIYAKDIILDQFKSPEDYQKFVLDQEDYGRALELIKHQLLDIEL